MIYTDSCNDLINSAQYNSSYLENEESPRNQNVRTIICEINTLMNEEITSGQKVFLFEALETAMYT